jgi:hypothetical protein
VRPRGNLFSGNETKPAFQAPLDAENRLPAHFFTRFTFKIWFDYTMPPAFCPAKAGKSLKPGAG